MKRFLRNLAVFSIPFVLVLAFPLSVFLLSGEQLSMASVVERQQSSSDDIRYLSAITSTTDRPYKFLSMAKVDPAIAVIGTSRTLTIRSGFFKDPSAFYNAGYNGGPSLHTQDLITFINSVPDDGSLKVLLFDATDYLTVAAEGPVQNDSYLSRYHTFFTTSWRTLYASYFSGKFSYLQLLKKTGTDKNIGITAHLYGQGYRKDGSLDRKTTLTPAQLAASVHTETDREVAAIRTDSAAETEYSATIPQQDLDSIAQFLALCKARNIYVIGYLAPSANEIDMEMRSLQDAYGNSYRTAPDALSPLFAADGYHFYDLRSLSTIGATDSELYDSHHPTEKATLRMLAYLADREPALKPYLDAKQLRALIPKQPY